MKSKALYRNLLIGILFLTSLIWFVYIGRYKTLYGAGILLIPIALVFALLPFFASAFIFCKSWSYSARVFLVSCAILFSGLITGYYINEYKPSVYVNIPANFEGCVFLFETQTENLDDVNASQHGIAYIPYGGHYYLKVRVGGKKRPEIMNSGNTNQISFYNADSTKIHWVNVYCWEIDADIDYSTDLYVPRDFNPCMQGRELRMLIEMNHVDSSILKWSFFNYRSDTYYDP